MNYAGLAVEAPFLKDITLAAITEFLKKRTDYLFNIGKVNESLDDDSKIIRTSLVASVDNDLLAIICTTELEIAADELEDQVVQQYLEGFLASSSRELGWTMEKYFEEIEYDLSIKNPTSRVLDLWKQWTTIATKFDLHETLEDPKGNKQWREQIIKKLKPAALRKDITESLKWIGAKGQALRDDNLEFYKKVKSAAIEQEKSNRLYQEVRSEKSRSSTKTLTKHSKESKEQKRFREKESSQKQGSKDDKERIVKERSFSKKKLAVVTDPQFGGKDLALVEEKVWFPYILDSGAFTTVVPKSLLKKLKEAGSGVVEATLEKDVEMKMAVKDVVTIAKSMIHITVELTTRAGPVRIRSLSALVAQDEMEDMLIGEDLLKCLGIDPHEILAARLEEGTLEAEIDATKMADKSAQRQKLSMIVMSGTGIHAGEDMKSADASQSPDLEGGDDCFQEDGDETLLDQAIAGMIQRASMYLDEGQLDKLRSLVEKHREIWRVSLTDDGPAKVKPFKVHLKSDTVPRRARARKYAPNLKHVRMLEKNGFIRKNSSSRWSSPVLIVPNPGKRDEFRMIVDCRYANSQVQLVAGFLPILEVKFQHLEKDAWFSSLDAFKGFWHFPLAEERRGILFLDGTWCVYTNTVDPGKH
jgi:hypothetical protein